MPDSPGTSNWAQSRRSDWTELEHRITRLDKAGHSVSAENVVQYARLHRAVASDLLVAQSGGAGSPVVEYLNDLVGRSYSRLYTWQSQSWSSPLHFLGRELPRLIRQHGLYVWAAGIAMAVGFILGFSAMIMEPSARYHLLPAQHQGITPQQRILEDTHPDVSGEIGGTRFGLFLTLHNLRIALLAFLLGIFFGVFTFIVICLNGMLIGALAADYQLAGSDAALFFWSWILPHGIPEFFAIALAGAAGLMLGRAALMPGRLTTREAVAKASGPAVRLFVGTLPLFLIAGLIEATISQIHPPAISYAYKLLFSGGVLVTLLIFTFGAGRAEGAAAIDHEPDQVWHRIQPSGVLEILTPEHVIFRYRLAGLFTRAHAASIDMIRILFFAGVASVFLPVILQTALLAPLPPGGAPERDFMFLMPLLTLLVTILYYMIYERSATSTIGKRRAGLRVLDERGLGMTRMQRMVRSLFRAIDLLPYPGFYFVGCISSMLGVGRQRIGDRIAGTLVVQEGRSKLPVTPQMERDWYLAELGSEQRKHIARVLSGEERDLLLQLAIRRHHLDLSARLALNHQARVYFEGRTDWPKPANLPDERYVTALAWAVLPRTPSAKRKTRRTKKTRRTRKTKRTWKRYKADE